MNRLEYIHGSRIATQVLDEDSTVDDLSTNVDRFVPPSKRRQHATQPVQISQLVYIPAPESESLKIKAEARNFESGKKYTPVIAFNDIAFEEEDTPQNVTFTAVDGAKYHVAPINLRRHTCRVACNCLDFYFRFAVWNFNDNSLEGPKPPPYVKKTNRPPVNPQRKPGLCKHLLKLIQELKHSRLVQI
jgi:hypothetical protein